MPKSHKPILAGVFFLGLSVILFEIALTRVFAIMMWHHFTYMVISIGLLGFGASGSLITAFRLGERRESPARALVRCSVAYAFSVVLAFCFATLIRIDSLAIWQQKENFVALFFLYLVIGVPFLLGGMGIGLALVRLVEHVNRLYFADLCGSAAGAALSVLLMKSFGGSAAVVFAGTAGALAAFCFSLAAPRRYLVLSVPTLLLAALIGASFAGGVPALGIPSATWRVPFAPGKEAAYAEQILGEGMAIERIPSATAEVEVGPDLPSAPTLGGDNGLVDERIVRTRAVGQDGTAPTMLFEGASDLSRFPFLDDSQASTAYVVHRASGRKPARVMVIGVGGGVDVMAALLQGAEKVTAVELNTAMIEMVKERYDDYLGGLFREGAHALSDRIELVNSEGRAWLRSHDEVYDVIQMSGVDSYTALSTGAYTLSESYLYTVEAVRDFYRHLSPDGVVTYSRFIENAPVRPRETLRLANIACAGLRASGVEDPASHVAVFQGVAWASTMIKKSPFTREEARALEDFARREGFVGLVFDPTSRPPSEAPPARFAALRQPLLDAIKRSGAFPQDPGGRNEAFRSLLDACAAVARGEEIGPALLPEAGLGDERAKAALGILRALRDRIAEQGRYVVAAMADFDRLLRGSPSERDEFVREYEYDVSPATDDRPFFFNYYRWSSLFGGSRQRRHDPRLFAYQTDFPVGHWILLGSLAQIVLLAGLSIFLPLRKLALEGVRTGGALRYFAYFAALGLGFMLIEIALMQKLVIFLGHPTYALSVVLVSLLASAGVGSLVAGRIRVVERRHLLWILLAIAAAIALDAMAVNWLLPALLGQPLGLRVVVTVLLLLPTGFALGMPFPTGMRVVESRCPHLVPWGWAVNAFFSVFGSIFCIVLSMAIGFSNVLLAAALVYTLGLAGMKAMQPRASRAPESDTAR